MPYPLEMPNTLDITLLSPYMLTGDRINHYLSYSINNNINKFGSDKNNDGFKKDKSNNYNNNSCYSNKIKKPEPFFIPKQKDGLFWCLYIIVNGLEKYQSLDFINVVVEKTMKIEYVERLRKKKDLLKMNKCAPLLHIENMLVNEIKIDMKTFMALCVLENKNILFINNKYFYELEMNSLTEVNIIHFFRDNSKYGLEVENIKVEEYRNSLYKISNLDKPIKAFSSYKSEELIEIASKLGIETKKEDGKNVLKKEVYEKIMQYLS